MATPRIVVRSGVLIMLTLAGCDGPKQTFQVSDGASTRREMRFKAMDDDKDKRVSVAEWRRRRSDTTDIATVDRDADGFISFAEFSAWSGAESPTMSEPAAERPSAAPSGNDGAPDIPDIPETPEPTRRKPTVDGADDEEGPTPITRRRAAASAPDAPAAPMKRPAPAPVRPPL